MTSLEKMATTHHEPSKAVNSGKHKDHCVFKFIGVTDLPTASDFRPKCNPYLRAHLEIEIDKQGRKHISEVVTTPKRLDCQSAIWNSYRDFRVKIQSLENTFLVMEILHATYDPTKPDSLLGRGEVCLSHFKGESPLSIPMITLRSEKQSVNAKNFQVLVSRACLHHDPPTRKVIFLIRHGESKWNEAQSKINITGLLDRDHSLTELGIFQARELNRRWRTKQQVWERKHYGGIVTNEPPPFASSPSNTRDTVTEDLLGLNDASAESAPTTPTNAPQSSLFDALNADFVSPMNVAPPPPAIAPISSVSVISKLAATVDGLSPKTTESATTPPPPPPGRLQPSLTSKGSNNDLWDLLSKPIIDFTDDQDSLQDIEARQSFDEGDDSEDESDSEDDSSDDADRAHRPLPPLPPLPHLPAKSTHSAGDLLDFGGNSQSSSPIPIPVPSHSLPANSNTLEGGEGGSEEVASYRSTAEELLDAFHKKEVKIKEDKEAAQRRRNDYIELFLHADGAYSSPLTRALQTALISLEGHPVLTQSGMHLYSIIREVKNIGGLDTVGIETGDGIGRRAMAELSAILGPQRAAELLDLHLHINDTDQVWWTPMASYDSDRDQQSRIREFVTFMRFEESKIPIVVGHSLFFKAFYSKRISHSLMQNRKYLSHNLQKFRLSNASMLAVTVAFGDVDNGCSDALLLDADLIFGGGFHAPGNQGNRNSLERKASKALTEAAHQTSITNQVNTSKTSEESDEEEEEELASGGRKRSESSAIAMIGSNFANFKSDLKSKTDAITTGLTNGVKKLSDTLHDMFEK